MKFELTARLEFKKQKFTVL